LGIGDWKKSFSLPSPVEPFRFQGRDFFLKRDDLIDPRFSGNKFRKLQTLFFIPSNRYSRLLSYGGAQSNAMLSLAHLAAMKGWRFDYYVKRLPSWLKAEPTGNFAAALGLGMHLHEVATTEFYETVERVRKEAEESDCFVPQGGADAIAEAGVEALADEITAWALEAGIERFTVATPSGTGTTALFLRKFLPPSVTVVTTPVVGDAQILKAQWQKLDPNAPQPKILDGRSKWPFAKPRREFYEIWRELSHSGVTFDMIYAPKMWLALLKAYEALPKPILYVHSGGVSGNESQLKKYRFKRVI